MALEGLAAPIVAEAPGNPVLKQILKQGENWQLIASDCDAAATLASNSRGQVFYQNAFKHQISELKADGTPQHCGATGVSGVFAFGPGDKLYMARTRWN
jgi:hypothetical protein